MIGNLYITGFMGAGKTSVGRELALLTGRRLVDMDDELVKVLGMKIADAFAHQGEAAFRRAETGVLRRLAKRNGLVVATGGGVPQSAENRALMRASGKILHLSASLEECRSHLGPEAVAQRPLWSDPAKVQALYDQRQEAYADNDLSVNLNGQTPQELTRGMLAALLPDQEFAVSLGGQDSPVMLTCRAPQALGRLAASRRVALITDRNVAGLHLERYTRALPHAVVITLAPGEGSKSLRRLEQVYQAMLEARLERGDMLVALGGGVITDLGAFVAATYKRGMDFVLASTSLLGCVDAAIGGKAAVNLGSEKNQVGCFTRPKAVVLDLASLHTLPRKARIDGLSEAYKTGLVAEPALAGLLEENMVALIKGDVLGLASAVELAARAKGRVVSSDFTEAGLRRILNLGHTFGHALEGHNRFKISHGQAVAVGMMMAVAMSRERGLLDGDLAARITDTLMPLAPRKLVWPTVDEAWQYMLNDKKNRAGRVMFILLEGVGRPLVVEDVSQEEVSRAIAAVREEWHV